MKKYLLILFLFPALAYSQGVRLGIQSGYGLRTTRDSVLRFLSDSIAIRKQVAPQIRDSLDAGVTRGETIKRDTASLAALGDLLYPRTAGGAGIAADSMRRIAASPIAYYAHGSWPVDADTAGIRLFGLDMGGALGAGSSGTYMPYTAGGVPRTLVFDAVMITHSFDTSAFYRHRDTVIYLNGRDSIAAGSSMWLTYIPASDAVFNGTGAAILRISYVSLNATTGAYHDEFFWKIPLILGVRLSHRGVRSDHRIKVTLFMREKIPGRIY